MYSTHFIHLIDFLLYVFTHHIYRIYDVYFIYPVYPYNFTGKYFNNFQQFNSKFRIESITIRFDVDRYN